MQLNTTFPKRKLVLMGVNNKDGKTGGVIAIARVLEKKFPEDNAVRETRRAAKRGLFMIILFYLSSPALFSHKSKLKA